MVRRKNLFLKALTTEDISILPRLSEKNRDRKCPWCKFYDICMDKTNDEDENAKEMANEIDILDEMRISLIQSMKKLNNNLQTHFDLEQIKYYLNNQKDSK